MNELFCDPLEHNCLQDVINMFTLHIHPMGTQRTYQHFDKVDTWILKEIANNDIISIVIKKNIVNLSIPECETSTTRKTMHSKSNLPTSQLFVCYYVILNTKGRFTFLPPWVVGQQLASDGFIKLWQLTTSTWELFELEDWKPNKLLNLVFT
jgi:hypothetical protein